MSDYLNIQPLADYMNKPLTLAEINPEFVKGIPTTQSFIDDQIRKAAEECDAKCEANPLPPGYHYGPMETKWSNEDGNIASNMITVTCYREVRKNKTI